MNENAEAETVYVCDVDDPCLLFVSQFVLRSMKMKLDKWIKMITVDEYRVCIIGFLIAIYLLNWI